jgi:enoyl-CoA hydratase
MTAEQEASEQAVLTERRGSVLLITLNRPQVRNAVNAALAEGVGNALDELDGDDGLSAGVLTGAGGFFCAGMDLGAFVKGESAWFGDRGFAGITQRASRKPLIAAIEGFAVAGGMEIALSCDLIVAARGAWSWPSPAIPCPPSASTSSASSTGSWSPAAPSRRRSPWPPRSPRTVRSR